MLVLSRSAVRLSGLRGRRQLTALGVGRRGLRVVTGGDARSATSVLDHAESTTTTTTTIDDEKRTLTPSSVHDDPARQKIDMTFENAKEAYTSKTNFELLRGYTVFQMCSFRFFVNKNKQVNT